MSNEILVSPTLIEPVAVVGEFIGTEEQLNIGPISTSDATSYQQQQSANDDDDGCAIVFADAQATEDSIRGFSLADAVVPVTTTEDAPQRERRAEYISATVYKARGGLLGIGLKSSHQKNINNNIPVLKISSIRTGGLLEQSPFLKGDILISINHTDCKQMDERTAGELLKSLEGFVTIVVRNIDGDPCLVESMITKRRSNEVSGIGLTGGRRDNVGDIPVVTSINPHGLFASSLLNLGDRIISVNQQSCERLDSRSTANIIKHAPTTVSILARTLSETAAVVATSSFIPTRRAKFLSATIYKPHANTPVGLNMKVSTKNLKTLITISSIAKGSLMKEYTPFRVGDVLVSINGIKCVGASPKTVADLLKIFQGYLTIVAFNPLGDNTLVQTSTMKTSKESKIGISFKTNDEGQTIISTVGKGSHFAESLRIGDEILSVNGVPCDDIDSQTVLNIIKNAPKLVRILVRKASAANLTTERSLSPVPQQASTRTLLL